MRLTNRISIKHIAKIATEALELHASGRHFKSPMPKAIKEAVLPCLQATLREVDPVFQTSNLSPSLQEKGFRENCKALFNCSSKAATQRLSHIIQLVTRKVVIAHCEIKEAELSRLALDLTPSFSTLLEELRSETPLLELKPIVFNAEIPSICSDYLRRDVLYTGGARHFIASALQINKSLCQKYGGVWSLPSLKPSEIRKLLIEAGVERDKITIISTEAIENGEFSFAFSNEEELRCDFVTELLLTLISPDKINTTDIDWVARGRAILISCSLLRALYALKNIDPSRKLNPDDLHPKASRNFVNELKAAKQSSNCDLSIKRLEAIIDTLVGFEIIVDKSGNTHRDKLNSFWDEHMGEVMQALKLFESYDNEGKATTYLTSVLHSDQHFIFEDHTQGHIAAMICAKQYWHGLREHHECTLSEEEIPIRPVFMELNKYIIEGLLVMPASWRGYDKATNLFVPEEFHHLNGSREEWASICANSATKVFSRKHSTTYGAELLNQQIGGEPTLKAIERYRNEDFSDSNRHSIILIP